MAGGRRPSNFSSGSRHGAGEAHQAAAAAAYNYSIWQQPQLQTSPTSTQRPVSLPSIPPYIPLPAGSPSGAGQGELPRLTALQPAEVSDAVADTVVPTVANALASALDAAVRTAVSEHMAVALSTLNKEGKTDANADPADSSSPFSVGSSMHRRGADRGDNSVMQDEQMLSGSTSSFNHIVGSSRDSSVSGGDIASSEWHPDTEAQERNFALKRDFDSVEKTLQRLEARFEASESAASSREVERNAALSARLEAVEASVRRSEGEVTSLQVTLKSTQKSLADVRLMKRKSDSDADRLRTRVADLEMQVEGMTSLLESLPARVDALGRQVALDAKVRKADERKSGKNTSAIAPQLEKAVSAANAAQRHASDAAESVTVLRSRLKRVEDAVSKRKDETATELALQNGSIESLRGTATDNAASLQGLKRLVETNLRSHSAAEGIVKDQAQLITRHVCVALRRFIGRRITENNQLIDKTMRARVPAYAESNSSFVLVRSETENNGDTAPVLSTATSSVATDADMVENGMVYPLEAVEDALNNDAAMSALQ